ncbi:MAG: phosphoribosyltransferase family protein [Actinomycetota bacterium]|nr:phosphoribosyltransferase family protein [Actinomycetota bacterium]
MQKQFILTDDGLAMGSTMLASVNYCRHQKAAEVVAAVPVAGSRSAALISSKADRLVVLKIPENFRAVAQVYQNWHDVTDHQVLAILDQWEKLKESY